MIDKIADFFLLFSQIEVVLPLLMIGFLWLNRALFFQTACVSAFDLITNVALKISFQGPVSFFHKIDFSFPSGHMQFVIVVYVWIAYHVSSKRLWAAVVLVLFGVGMGLIHYDFHDVYDVLGGVLFGVGLIAGYRYVLLHWTKQAPWLFLVLASMLMVYNGFMYAQIPSHAWMAYRILVGIIVFERLVYTYEGKSVYWNPLKPGHFLKHV